jgi:hypothetical protein
MILQTASDKKAVRARFIVEAGEDMECLAKMAKEVFKKVAVADDESDKNNVPATISFMDDPSEILIEMPRWATLAIKDVELIKKTQWSNNRVRMKLKNDLAVVFSFKEEDDD